MSCSTEESKMKDRLNNLGKHSYPSKYKGIPRAQEIKDKISKSHIGIKHTEETKNKLTIITSAVCYQGKEITAVVILLKK